MNPIEAFYNNATVLVTGANGFLGSILVEKLLRCFNVKKIYVLLRSKGGKSVEERLQVMKKLAIFDEIRNQDQKLLEKLVAVEVDYNCSDLNIEEKIAENIRDEVEIVFNVMASVNFNNPLSDVIKTNILATGRIVHLAKEIENLKSFVHVSTLFSNVNSYNVHERIYPSDLSYQEFIEIGSKIIEKQNILENEACNPLKLPNTYTLTKHFAEKLVSHQASALPVGIFRPPIIVSSYKDLPGYTDNLNGPPGLLTGMARGIIQCVHVDPAISSNTAPVDYCVNALIATAWDIHKNFDARRKRNGLIPILNYMSAENNLTWGEISAKTALGLSPFQAKIWKISKFLVPSMWLFTFLNFLLNTLPALILDFIALFARKKRIHLKLHKKSEILIASFEPFTLNRWTFGNKNYKRLVGETKNFKFQRGEHSFDLSTIDWNEFYKNFLPGINRFYFKGATALKNVD